MKVREIADNMQNNVNNYNLAWLTMYPNNGQYIVNYILQNFSDFEMLFPYFVEERAQSQEIALHSLFQSFFVIHKHQLQKINDALEIEYNPTENYNGILETKDGAIRAGSDSTASNTNTQTIADLETTGKTTQFDSLEFKDTDKSIQHYAGSNINSNSSSAGVTFKNNIAKTVIDSNNFNEYSEHYENKHGNLGQTTTQKMLNEEIELRLKRMLDLYINTFCDVYMYYVKAVEM